MKRFELIVGIAIYLTTNAFSQVDYYKIKSQRLTPIIIDTLNESVIVIQKRFATVYFKQSDIKEYLKSYNVIGERIDMNHKNIDKLLSENKPYIRMTDWWYSYTEEERNKLSRNPNYSIEYEKFLDEMYYVGADLIHYGKFMIIDNHTKKIIIKGLKIKKQDGYYGTEYAQFLLPSRKSFWYIVTVMGE